MVPFAIQKYRALLWACGFAAFTEFLTGFAGSVISGNLLGEDALAGVSLASSIQQLLAFLASLIGCGMGINYSIRRGRLDTRGANEVFTQGLWTVFLAGGALAAAMVLGRDSYVAFMGPSAEVARYAREYWPWYVPSAIGFPLTVFLLNCCYADGDSRLCTITYGVQLAVNIGLSWALMKWGHGVAGCAIGLSAGYLAAAAVLSLHFLRRTNTFRLVRHFSLRDTWRIVASAIGDATGNIGDAIVFFVLGKLLISHYGSQALVVFPVFMVVFGLASVSNGIGVAVQPIVAVYHGESNHRSIRTVAHDMLKLTVGIGAIITAILLVHPDLALQVVGVRDPQIVPTARAVVRITVLGAIPMMIANVFNNYYQYIEHELLSLGQSLALWAAAPLLAMTVLVGVDEVWFWSWYPLGRWGGLLLFYLFVYCRYGRRLFPFLLDRDREANIRVFDLTLDEGSIAATSVKVGMALAPTGVGSAVEMRAQLMTEEVLMAVKDRNGAKRVNAEVTLDLNDGVLLTMRDDGEIFDITDSDVKVSGVRSFLVACMMEKQREKANLITTGFNRNVFRFKKENP